MGFFGRDGVAKSPYSLPAVPYLPGRLSSGDVPPGWPDTGRQRRGGAEHDRLGEHPGVGLGLGDVEHQHRDVVGSAVPAAFIADLVPQ